MIEAIVNITLMKSADAKSTLANIRAVNKVDWAWLAFGIYDVVAHVVATDQIELQNIIFHISKISGVDRTVTQVAFVEN